MFMSKKTGEILAHNEEFLKEIDQQLQLTTQETIKEQWHEHVRMLTHLADRLRILVSLPTDGDSMSALQIMDDVQYHLDKITRIPRDLRIAVGDLTSALAESRNDRHLGVTKEILAAARSFLSIYTECGY